MKVWTDFTDSVKDEFFKWYKAVLVTLIIKAEFTAK